MVPEKWTDGKALKLKNPLGKYGEYMRTTLLFSLISAAKENKGEESFHLFEMANIYLPQAGKLPRENMTLSGIIKGKDFRKAKGIVEGLLEELNIKFKNQTEDSKHFEPSKRLVYMCGTTILGEFGKLENENLIYYSFDVESLRKNSRAFTFKPIPKYPAQIEDLTIKFPEKTMIGDVIKQIKKQKNISNVELTTVYKENYTFRIWYQDLKKTLDDKEVGKIREKIISIIQKKFGGNIQD